MKALILENYKTPFVLKDVSVPVTGRGEVLARIMGVYVVAFAERQGKGASW
jgi:hypothetical protein